MRKSSSARADSSARPGRAPTSRKMCAIESITISRTARARGACSSTACPSALGGCSAQAQRGAALAWQAKPPPPPLPTCSSRRSRCRQLSRSWPSAAPRSMKILARGSPRPASASGGCLHGAPARVPSSGTRRCHAEGPHCSHCSLQPRSKLLASLPFGGQPAPSLEPQQRGQLLQPLVRGLALGIHITARGPGGRGESLFHQQCVGQAVRGPEAALCHSALQPAPLRLPPAVSPAALTLRCRPTRHTPLPAVHAAAAAGTAATWPP